MSLMRRLSFLAGVALLAIACSSSKEENAPDADLDAALGGAPDAVTQQALRAFEGHLTYSHLAYLSAARWPDDANKVLSDPMLRDVISLYVAVGLVKPSSFEAGLHTNHFSGSSGTYDPAVVQAAVSAAVKVMIAHNAAPTLRTPAGIAAFGNILANAIRKSTGPTPLPPVTTAADPDTFTCVIDFTTKPAPTTTQCGYVPLCCKGEITFPRGLETCYDRESCRGKGVVMYGNAPAPPPGSGSSGSSGTQAPTPLGTCKEIGAKEGVPVNDACRTAELVCQVYTPGQEPANADQCFATFWMDANGKYRDDLSAKYSACCVPR